MVIMESNFVGVHTVITHIASKPTTLHSNPYIIAICDYCQQRRLLTCRKDRPKPINIT